MLTVQRNGHVERLTGLRGPHQIVPVDPGERGGTKLLVHHNGVVFGGRQHIGVPVTARVVDLGDDATQCSSGIVTPVQREWVVDMTEYPGVHQCGDGTAAQVDAPAGPIGIDPAALERPPRVNESLSAAGAEALRALNAHVPELRSDGSFNGSRDGFLPEILERTKGMGRIALTAEQRARVEALSAAALEQLRSSYFPDRDPLFSPAPERDAPDPAQIRAQAMDVLAELLVRERAQSQGARSRLAAEKARLRTVLRRARNALRKVPALWRPRTERTSGD